LKVDTHTGIEVSSSYQSISPFQTVVLKFLLLLTLWAFSIHCTGQNRFGLFILSTFSWLY